MPIRFSTISGKLALVAVLTLALLLVQVLVLSEKNHELNDTAAEALHTDVEKLMVSAKSLSAQSLDQAVELSIEVLTWI